ncbi:MAG: ferric reductase-like transmembrane domain-containing protein [Pleurocapsa minor GSE-CHR-MK-17-07R]|jgi:predicted ferric reductase|nr:ferric reductase-like transmembrane domain-containing protein [Pleurocapsa minor GSE-CHR-MK 17-07R]
MIEKTQSTRRTDLLVIIVSLLMLSLSAVWMVHSGMFTVSLNEDTKLSWHLVRSSGIVSYVLLLASTLWGLFISAQFVKDWSPGPVSMTMHSTISWLALLLGLGHALLLLLDKYFSYTLGDLFIPFVGPYRPEAVGLGTLAFWMIVIVTLSFPLKKRLGHKTWKRLHYVSYAAFVMVSLHGLFAGTEGPNLGFRLLVGGGFVLVMLLLGIRIGKSIAQPARPAGRASKAEA